MKVRRTLATLTIAGAAIALPATAAFATPYGSPPPTQVVPTSGTPLPQVQTTVPPGSQVGGTGGTPAVQAVQAAPTAPAGSSLPLTGGDVAELTIIGLGLLGGGAILVRRTRVRHSQAND